ncbi:FISUMP domain-containing protein [Sphingobacterium sp. Mn56C]|uniref:FISUMP domain-containing protein n=1 Tax=Sphingobacterium sp. Mn56C TaxID=3395261 RepID=UPI003BE61584
MKSKHKNKVSLGQLRFWFYLFFIIISCAWACNKQLDTSAPIKDNPETDTTSVFMYLFSQAQYTTIAPLSKRFKVQINKDYALTGKLVSVDKVIDNRTNLPDNLMYNVVVFDKDGRWVTEKIYNYKKEAENGGITLVSKGEYTIVAYSTGSTSYVPSITFPNPNSKTLASAKLILDKYSNFLYFKTRVDLTDVQEVNKTKLIKATFNCKFSEIITTIDACQLAQPVTTLRSTFGRHHNNVWINLATGDLIKQEKALPIAVDFPKLGAKKVISSPTILHSDGHVSFNILALKAGPLTVKNTITLDNLALSSGVRYQLNLKLEKSSDALLRHEGQAAFRIHGQIWMMDNLGVDPSDPKFDPLGVHHGHFFQYANKNIIAKATVYEEKDTKWMDIKKTMNWNSGTEEEPIKSKLDPCPKGFRVPTISEFNILIDNITVEKNRGSDENSLDTYTFAKVFKSKWSTIEVDFPLQGYFSERNSSNWDRGHEGHYWTSSADDYSGSIYVDVVNIFKDDPNIKLNLSNVNSKNYRRAYNIRCIADL